MASKKVLLIGGEPSGDLQSGELAKALKELSPEIELFGVGGWCLKNAGVHIINDSSSWSAIGIFDSLVKVLPVVKAFNQLCNFIKKEKPDVAVLIDFPAFNMQVAKVLQRLKIPIVYYFPPSQWSKDPKRLNKIAQRVTKVIAVFPFTAQAYKDAGLDVHYFGHPLLDLVVPTKDKDDICREYKIDLNKRLIGLLPGSRTQEIRYILPRLILAGKIMLKETPNIHFLLPVATPAILPIIQSIINKHPDFPVTLAIEETYNFMNASEFLIVTSGTATLEGALFLKPMVIVYRLSWLSWYLAKLIVKYPYAGLPNLIANKVIVPELLQDEASPLHIAKEGLSILLNPKKQEEIIIELDKIIKLLGNPGVIPKVAKIVMDMM